MQAAGSEIPNGFHPGMHQCVGCVLCLVGRNGNHTYFGIKPPAPFVELRYVKNRHIADASAHNLGIDVKTGLYVKSEACKAAVGNQSRAERACTGA